MLMRTARFLAGPSRSRVLSEAGLQLAPSGAGAQGWERQLREEEVGWVWVDMTWVYWVAVKELKLYKLPEFRNHTIWVYLRIMVIEKSS